MLSNCQLFDHRFVAISLMNTKRCPKCRNEYSCTYDVDKFDKDFYVKSNRPFLLPCGHNMCENCIQHNRQKLSCSTCLKPIEIHEDETKQFSNFHVRDKFDMNFFLLGELYHWRFYRKDASANSNITMSPTVRNHLSNALFEGDASMASSTVLKCAECDAVPSIGKCRLCKACYCKRCFDNIHKNRRALKTHTLQRYDMEKSNKSDLMFVGKPRFCKKHQRRCDRYCPKCDFICCGECAQQDHQFHNCRRLLELNQALSEELNITLENAQLAYENLQKGQKEIKAVENQLEEYAMKTLEEISNHFLQLHSFLQNEEKQIMDTFSSMCQLAQFNLREANFHLIKQQESLNFMRNNLEQFRNTDQKNIYLGHILPKYDQQIQKMPCQIEITKPRQNPFNFEIKRDLRSDIQNSIAYSYKDPKISIMIDNSFYNSQPSYNDTTNSMASALNATENTTAPFMPAGKTKPKKNKKLKPKVNLNENLNAIAVATSNHATSLMGRDLTGQQELLVHVTQIKSPENFFIQNDIDMQSIRQLSHTYLSNDISNRIPKSISIGYYYMAYHVNDKQWYRGMLKKILPNELYKIFLVDFGINMQVSKDNLCEIEEQHLKIPFAAIRCAIFDIMPVGKKWTEVENSLLLELLQNKPARMSIIERINNEMLKIDLHTQLTKSVRDTFLYTGLARERSGEMNFKLQAKLPIIKMEDRIPKSNVHTNEILSVTMLNAIRPQEFYVIKNDAIESKRDLMRDMNQYYNNDEMKIQQIYLGTTQMCCAIKFNDTWHRAVIDEIKGGGLLSVRLVDEGRKEIITWRKAFVLAEQFRKKREFAIPCFLADIEPLQENNYDYTDEAVNHFRQMSKNPHLRMEVVAATTTSFKVVLFICKKNSDKNIAAVMIDNGYGISTGEYSQITEIARNSANSAKPALGRSQLPLSMHNDRTQKVSGTATKPLKRTPIIVTHIISPGEFYIQLASLSWGTKTFHKQIQETQSKEYGTQNPLPLAHEVREWLKDDHCLVYTKYHSYNSRQFLEEHVIADHCEWYRGIITDITHLTGKKQTYSVFLRDIGITICSIYSQQLFTINPQLDRVTNAVYCCHLACIEPAGGKSWSHSAIDCFSHYIITAETLSVSMQGKRNPETNSLPIVLWSSKIETTDPLAPCITKYLNINRNLVTKGLAHMVEPLDTKQQFDQIDKMELKNGEITLELWFKSFSNNGLLNDVEMSEKLQSNLCSNTHDSVDTNDCSTEDHPLSVHLTEIDLNETTNKRAPKSWFETNVIKKTIFAGYPTYIDFESIVYIHDAADRPLLDKITKKITETYGQLKTPSNDYKFIKEQACVVKYHVDSKYYRGIIKEDLNSDLEWGVYFIDYGNTETVTNKDLRPYAPFPNLPAMANKFLIDGIKPKDGAKKYKESELDQMHILIVAKLVSVRIPTSQLENEIKRCSICINTMDAASVFIERGLADADYKPLKQMEVERQAKAGTKKTCKNRNPLPCSSVMEDYPIFSQDDDDVIEDVSNDRYLSSNSIDDDDDDDDSGNDDEKFMHLNEMFERLSKIPNETETFSKTKTKTTTKTESVINSTGQNKSPPHKKRMFNDKDYSDMMKEIMVFEEGAQLNDFVYAADEAIGNDQADVIKLGEHIAMNYWHNSVENMRLEEDDEINRVLDERVLSSEEQDIEIESDFERFYPNETSTVFTHFSGIDRLRPPQLPTAMQQFNCRVISIITPTILQVFPLHTEFRYREVGLQRLIKELVKKSLPPLMKFEPRTLCLARYSKDKVWYRAVIRSYNPNAKTVDVLYVDYLNSETLSVKYIRQCPTELLDWPLRTFRVRLYGVKVNPHFKEHEIRMILHRLLTKQHLFAVVKKNLNCHSLIAGNNFDSSDLLEIALYESKEASLKGLTVYQSLIENNYFQRI